MTPEMRALLEEVRDNPGAISPYAAAGAARAALDEIEELRAVLQGIIDLSGTMSSALYAETVDRAARRALADGE